MFSDVELAWVAGLLEGEGSFMTKTGGNSPKIQCTMTDLDVLERLQILMGGRIHPVKTRMAHWKDAYMWTLNGQPAADAMKALYPWMASRRRETIDRVLAKWDNRSTKKREASLRGEEAARFYLEMEKPSLRVAATKFNVSFETVRRHLK